MAIIRPAIPDIYLARLHSHVLTGAVRSRPVYMRGAMVGIECAIATGPHGKANVKMRVLAEL